MNLKDNFSTDLAKKILWNKDNAIIFLLNLQEKVWFELPFKIISRWKNKWKKELNLSTDSIRKKIVQHRDFKIAEKIIRDLFKDSPKYKSGIESYKTMNILLDERNKIQLWDINWPFSQWDFDGFVQRVNSEKIDWFKKDEKVKYAAVKYRRIKEINTVRNDFIETLIFEKNENILPTLNHNRWVDFFINWVSFDQKVAKSPTNQFKKDFWESWKEVAIQNPDKVAEYLYKYQDEWRFWADSRLLVVYLDEDVSIQRIAETIQKTDLENPLEINFEYIHNQWKPTENERHIKLNVL